MATEDWRPVVGYEGLYSISNHGRLRRDTATLAYKAGKIIRGHKRGIGYLAYSLCRDGKEVCRLAHRLVCEAFHGPCPPGNQCNHLDGNKANNRADNLEWVTPKENVRHAIDVLGWNPRFGGAPRGDSHYNVKLSAADIEAILERGGQGRYGGPTQSELAKEYGVTRMTVYRVLHGKARSNRPAVDQHGKANGWNAEKAKMIAWQPTADIGSPDLLERR